MNEPEQTMRFQLQPEIGDGAGPSAALPVRTILVVDDYPSLCELIAAMLRSSGYQVLVASSGEEASVIAAREGETIDLLLTDMEMPQMCGDELAEWFHAQKPAIPILFMSSQARAPKSIESGHFLQKPFRLQELISKVRDLLEPVPGGRPEENSSSDHANQ